MPDGAPSTQGGTFPKRALGQVDGARRQVSNPLALGLLGLTFAITLWAFGYRLSQYTELSHSSSPRIPAAKLWSEHRSGVAAFLESSTSVRLKTRVSAQPDVFSLSAAAHERGVGAIHGLPVVPSRGRAVPFFHSSIPLRSPPRAFSL